MIASTFFTPFSSLSENDRGDYKVYQVNCKGYAVKFYEINANGLPKKTCEKVIVLLLVTRNGRKLHHQNDTNCSFNEQQD
jgi:hypothetical protein